MKKWQITCFVFFWAVALSACGKGAAPFVASPGVIILPSTVTLHSAQTQQFQATVLNTSTSVIWSVDGSSSNGSIDANGLYTAPASISATATAVVRAKLSNNTSTEDTAQVDLTP